MKLSQQHISPHLSYKAGHCTLTEADMKCFLNVTSLPSSRISIHHSHKLALDSLLQFLPSSCEVSVYNVGLYSVKVKNIVVQVTLRQDTPTIMFSTVVYKANQEDMKTMPPSQRRRYKNSLLTAMIRSNTTLSRSKNLEKIFSKDERFIYFLHTDERILQDQDQVHRLLEDFLLMRAKLLRNFHQVDGDLMTSSKSCM